MLVQKFGGTSVVSVEKILAIAKNIKDTISKNEKLVIVVSAMSGETARLTLMASDICNSNTREIAQIISTGENQVAGLMALALNKYGTKAISLTGSQIGIITDDNHLNAFINDIEIDKIKNNLKKYQVVVVAGFQGITKSGEITTLGKGGSDTTATALAGALKCKCEIYTDVSGIFTADPKLYKNAKKLKEITYDELMEMSASGAKVMETRSVEIAKKYNAPLYVGKSLEQKKDGSLVVENTQNFEYMPIKNITVNDEIIVIKIVIKNLKVLPKVFKELSKNYQKVELISLLNYKNKNILKLSINKKNCKKIIKNIKNKLKINKNNIFFEKNICKVNIVGTGFATHSLIINDIISVLNSNKIKLSNLVVSEISVGFTIPQFHKNLAVKKLCQRFKL